MRRLQCAASLLTGLALLCASSAAQAQDRYGMLVLELPASARALALGDAFPLGAEDADALLYAPAFAGTLRGFSAGLGWWSSSAMALSLAGAGEWWGGALGGALQTLDYEAAVVGYDDPAVAESQLGADAPVRITERAASLGYAHRIWKLDVSAAAKLLETRAGGGSARGVAFDVAVGRALGPVRLVLAGRHLGPALELDDVELTLPARASLTAATTRPAPLGPLDIGAAATVAVREDGTVLPGAGVEVGYWPVVGRTFLLRAGVRRAEGALTPFTLGAGFAGDRIALDWAYAPYDDAPASGAHRISVRLR